MMIYLILLRVLTDQVLQTTKGFKIQLKFSYVCLEKYFL